MKRMIAMMILAVTGVAAAPWDGTRGSITVATASDGFTTVLSLTTSDPSVNLFEVVVTEKCLAIGTCIGKVTRRFVPRLAGPQVPPPVSFAVFNLPVDHIASVGVTAFTIADSQLFMAN